MSTSKSVAQAMQYELTGTSKVKDARGTAIKVAETLGTHSLVWLLVKRHRVAILAAGNVVLVLNWAIPEWPTILRSLF